MQLQLHADVDGSLEALTSALLALNSGMVVFKVVKASIGPPSPADIDMAHTTGASIVAFGVTVDDARQKQATMRGVDIVASEYVSVPCSAVLACAVKALC